MAELTQLDALRLALAVVTAGVYAYVGSRLRRRRVEGEAKLAWGLFVQWWYGLAALTAGGLVVNLAARAGWLDDAAYRTAILVLLLGVCYVLWALQYYLLYLLTGKRSVLPYLTAFYVALFVALLYVVTIQEPYFDEATAAIGYRAALPRSHPALVGTTIVLVAPFLASAVGYLRLYFAAEGPTQRYRIGLIAATILGWFGTSLVSALPTGETTLGRLPWWPVATALVGLAAAMALLLAYLPPTWVRARFGVEAIEERAG